MEKKKSNTWNIILWGAQLLLAATFMWAGAMKLFSPEALPWPWIKAHPDLVKLTGMLDVLAGLGLVLPAWLKIQPKLTVLAAYGIVALMAGAILFHFSRGEAAQTGFNIFVALTALFIAWGRQKKAPILRKA